MAPDPMGKIDLYVFRQVALALLSITVVLTIAIWLAYSLRFLDYIVNRGLPLGTFLYLVVLLLPRFLATALPIALVCAVLFVYFRLMTDSELVVLRAAGLSDLRMSFPALSLAGLVMIFVAVLNFQITPMAARAFKDLQFSITNNLASVLVQPGVFTSIADGITFHVREVGTNGRYAGILIHDTSDPAKRVTLIAERGTVVQSDEGTRIVLIDGNRQEFDPATEKLSLLYFDRYTVDLGPDVAATRIRQNYKELSLSELLMAKPEDIGQESARKFHVEGHARILSGASAPTLTAVALAALLFGEINRRSYARRLTVAGLAPLGVLTASLMLKGLAAKVPQAIPLLYLNHLLPFAGSIWLLARGRRYGSPNRRASGHAAETARAG